MIKKATVLLVCLNCFYCTCAWAQTLTNPIAPQGADPWIVKQGDTYVYCYSTGDNSLICVNTDKTKLVRRLVYSVPPPKLTSLGIHITLDLDGRVRLGPSAYYVDSIDYAIDSRHKELFYNSAKKLLASLEYNDLEPEMAGIRPKLQGPGEDYRDFIIKEESDKGLPGFINLIGIDSPGLTAAPAIAEYTGNLVKV